MKMIGRFLGKDRAEEQRDRLLTYKRLFASEDGKIVLFDLMNRFHILNSTNSDPEKEGERRAVLYILEQCHYDIAEFDKRLKGE